MKTKTYLMTGGLLAFALVTIVPSASAHNEPCWINVHPIGGDLSGCLHNAGDTTVIWGNWALGTTGTQCNWVMGNPILGSECPFVLRALSNPF